MAEHKPDYRLAGGGRHAAEDDRLGLLERIFDPLSRRRRELVRPGWRCLEVGAGRGSMAVWLAEQVGESGHVVATDIDFTYLQRLNRPNLEVRKHNILEDPLDALEPGSFDLVSSRLMLFWLAGKQELAIRPWWSACGQEDGSSTRTVIGGRLLRSDPSHPYSAQYDRIHRGGEWWTSRGYDPIFGRKLPILFERCGLENISHAVTAEVVRGDSPWARWWQDTLEGIREWERANGRLTASQEEDVQATHGPLDRRVVLVHERAYSRLPGSASWTGSASLISATPRVSSNGGSHTRVIFVVIDGSGHGRYFVLALPRTAVRRSREQESEDLHAGRNEIHVDIDPAEFNKNFKATTLASSSAQRSRPRAREWPARLPRPTPAGTAVDTFSVRSAATVRSSTSSTLQPSSAPTLSSPQRERTNGMPIAAAASRYSH